MVGEQDAKVKSDDMSSIYSTLGVEMPKREDKESTDTNLPTPPEARINKGGNIPPPAPPKLPPAADRKDKYKRPEVENVSDALRELKYYIEEKSGFENDIAHHEDILFKEALDIFPEWNMKKISSQLSKLNEESENGRNEEKKGELIDKVGSMIETPQVLDSVDKIVIELTKQLVENSRKPEELKMKSSNPLEMLWAATSLVEFRKNTNINLGKAVAFLKGYPSNYFDLAGSFTKTRKHIDDLIKEYKGKIGEKEKFFKEHLEAFVKIIIANNRDFTQCGGKNNESNDKSKKPECDGENPQNWNLPEWNDWTVYHNEGVDVEGFKKFETLSKENFEEFIFKDEKIEKTLKSILNHLNKKCEEKGEEFNKILRSLESTNVIITENNGIENVRKLIENLISSEEIHLKKKILLNLHTFLLFHVEEKEINAKLQNNVEVTDEQKNLLEIKDKETTDKMANDKITTDKMEVDKTTTDKKTNDKITVKPKKDKKTRDKMTKMPIDKITKLHDEEKEVENKFEFSDVQKELLEIGGMKDRMTETMLDILNLIYTKNETTKEEVEHLLEEKRDRIAEAEAELSKSGYIDLEKKRKTFLSIKNFINDYNHAVEKIILYLNENKPEIQQITTDYKKLRLYRGMNDAVEMLYISSYRLALSSEQTLKSIGDNSEEMKKKVEKLKVEIDENIASISKKYGLSHQKEMKKLGKKKLEKLGDIRLGNVQDLNSNVYSSINEYLTKVGELKKNLKEILKKEKSLNEDEIDYVKINGLEEDLEKIRTDEYELKKIYNLKNLEIDMSDSMFHKDTLSIYLKKFEKEETKIDGEKSLSFGKEHETQMTIKEEESSSIKANLRKSKSSKPSFSSQSSHNSQSSLNSESSHNLQPSLNSQSSFNSQTSSDSGESYSHKSLKTTGFRATFKRVKHKLSRSEITEDITKNLEEEESKAKEDPNEKEINSIVTTVEENKEKVLKVFEGIQNTAESFIANESEKNEIRNEENQLNFKNCKEVGVTNDMLTLLKILLKEKSNEKH
uniref:Uncharacterized protein n=1 Tax=Meloidogyne javanica TaxID=6303 RepID=A0A915LQX3_MELJA